MAPQNAKRFGGGSCSFVLKVSHILSLSMACSSFTILDSEQTLILRFISGRALLSHLKEFVTKTFKGSNKELDPIYLP
jgi:hypothetical protein